MALAAPRKVELALLDLDPDNPRLRINQKDMTQDKLREWMIREQEVEELGESIAENGFMENEAIVAQRSGNRYIVLEGNRRVAALQLLKRPDLAPARQRLTWQELSKRFAARKQDVGTISVHIVAGRTDPDAEAYIAVRHVKGTKTWPPAQKAQYIARLLERPNASFSTVARKIGSNIPTVQKHYVAYKLVKQSLDDGLEGAHEMYEQFGVLMRAFQSPKILKFLGLDPLPESTDPTHPPVPERQRENLKDFSRWTFGAPDSEKIIPESRHMTKWGEILSSTRAVEYLRSVKRPAFWIAYEKSGGQIVTLVELLSEAANALREAVPIVRLHAENPEVISSFKECTEFYAQILERLGKHVADRVVATPPSHVGKGR